MQYLNLQLLEILLFILFNIKTILSSKTNDTLKIIHTCLGLQFLKSNRKINVKLFKTKNHPQTNWISRLIILYILLLLADRLLPYLPIQAEEQHGF